MQGRRSAVGGPLSILLPHPTLRRRSSLVGGAASPHTPRNLASPTCSAILLQPSANRKSSDSWSSSIDDREHDWYPDQILLLSRTLDALPSHLMTPFHGAVPPSNLLDKVARGISDAKGVDWPHSVRATRLKLAEISRAASSVIPEEKPEPQQGDYFADTTNLSQPPKRQPLYRQSSMDFIKSQDVEIKDPERIDRLSSRLQKVDRVVSTGSPYNTRSASRRNSRRASSPPRPNSLVNGPSTASSSTLASLGSGPSEALRPRVLRRTLSGLSAASSVTCASSAAPSIPSDRMSISSVECCIAAAISSTESLVRKNTTGTRTKRSGSFTTSSSNAVKRAPSYGTIAQEAKAHGREGAVSPCCPSSDEEEKARTRTTVKKARTKSSLDVSNGQSVLQQSPVVKTSGKTSKKKSFVGDAPRRPTMNPQRNPSMFGAELPRIPTKESQNKPSPAPLLHSPTITAPQPRTLRRVKRLSSPSSVHSVGRKISFGSLAIPQDAKALDEDDEDIEMRTTKPADLGRLGSAFSLA